MSLVMPAKNGRENASTFIVIAGCKIKFFARVAAKTPVTDPRSAIADTQNAKIPIPSVLKVKRLSQIKSKGWRSF